MNNSNITPDQLERIKSLCSSNKKLEAVKLYKSFTNKSLPESKNMVEEICIENNIKPKKTSWKGFVIAIIVIFGLIAFIVSMCSKEEPAPKLTKQQIHLSWINAQFESDGSNFASVQYIQSMMNNAKSFDYIETKHVVVKDGIEIYTTFTGTNTFGGVVKNTAWTKIDSTGSVVDYKLLY
ncbi:MAG: hypothetical protein WCK09_21000 [Bacteroidota bacterium]